MNKKVILKGKLFVLVEEGINPEDDIDICAEVDGINIWDWLNHHREQDVKITLESEENER
jgi:hypothetical protein